ncbi:MAG: rhamnogalacturonan acetylesterase [Tidjanibacter sp.]|nr:rhamnogalacturonan acetylesterase [Tidjanibacter sp.]
MKKSVLVALVVALFSLTFCDTNKEKPTLYIIGDSTVAQNSGKIVGWGSPIADMFDTTRINVVNKARGGRSSRTYLNEGLWQEVCDMLKPGDFVLMGFGHNDGNPQGRGSAMGGYSEETTEVTKPDGTTELVHTFGWYMTKFVRDAKEKGATPILFSQIPWRELYDGKSKRSDKTFGKWLGEIAEAEQVQYVDLNSMVADKYEAMGQEAVNAFFPGDHTHTNIEGATLNAQTMIEGLQQLEKCKLVKYIKK